jgi:hypothetical protein
LKGENFIMKKNVMMRVASVLLVAVMLTTCVISGTFAKYVTSGEGTDSARVAKWGVTVVSNGKMFGEHYNGTDDDKVALSYTGSVDSQGEIPGGGESNIVAPGTKGDMVSVALSGKPEVAVKVTYTADVTLTGWEVEGTDYCPIKITVNGTVYQIAVGTDAADLEAAVEAAITAYSQSYPAGTDLSAVGADALMVSWEWPFESGNDELDTKLGNLTAAGTPAKISITVTTTVTQID